MNRPRPWWRAPKILVAGAAALALLATVIVVNVGSDGGDGDRPPGEEFLCADPDDVEQAIEAVECEAIGNVSDDVVVLTDVDLDFSELDREGPSVIEWADGDPPAVGKVLVTTVGPDAMPFYGKVVEVNGRSVRTEHVSLMEVFDDLSLDLDVAEITDRAVQAASEAEFGPADDLPPMEDLGVEVQDLEPEPVDPADHEQAVGELPSERFAAKGKKAQLVCGAGISAQADVRIYPRIGQGNVKLVWQGANLTGAEYRFSSSVDVVAAASVSGQGQCGVQARIFEQRLPTITILIGPIPIVITQNLGVDLEATAAVSGGWEMSTGVRTQVDLGVRINLGKGFTPFAGAKVVKLGEPASPEIEVNAEIGAPVSYEAALYGMFGARASLGPFVGVVIAPAKEQWLTIEGGLKASFSLFAKVEIPFFVWESTASFGARELIRVPIDTKSRPVPATTTTTTTTTPGAGGGGGDPGGNPPAPSGALVALDQARGNWGRQPQGASYVLAYELSGEGDGAWCVEGIVGDPSRTTPFAQGQGCGRDEASDPIGPLGVEGWHDYIAGAISRGSFVSATYDPSGRPSEIRTTDADGLTATLSWLLPPGG